MDADGSSAPGGGAPATRYRSFAMTIVTTLDTVGADLAAEQEDLDRIVRGLGDPDLDTPTPSPGWSVRDQVTHLAFFDGRASLAIVDPEAFTADVRRFLADPKGVMADHLTRGHGLGVEALLGWWRDERSRFLEAARGLDPATRVPWYGPPMSPVSFVTARLMETWCHGQDVADTVGVTRQPSARLRHVAHIGVRARGFSYVTNGRAAPAGEVRVELTAPDGGLWSWGDAGSADRVTGSALDFCLVVTQRRHRDDTALRVEGPLAREWMEMAQAFAGPPGEGRRPGQFPSG
jgi:uncharacterized protein (TIGR03084 family)